MLTLKSPFLVIIWSIKIKSSEDVSYMTLFSFMRLFLKEVSDVLIR